MVSRNACVVDTLPHVMCCHSQAVREQSYIMVEHEHDVPQAAPQPQLVRCAPTGHGASWWYLCLTDTWSAMWEGCSCCLHCTLCICCMQVMHLLLLELLKRPRDAALLEFMRIDEMLIDIGKILSLLTDNALPTTPQL